MELNLDLREDEIVRLGLQSDLRVLELRRQQLEQARQPDIRELENEAAEIQMAIQRVCASSSAQKKQKVNDTLQ